MQNVLEICTLGCLVSVGMCLANELPRCAVKQPSIYMYTVLINETKKRIAGGATGTQILT